MEQTIAKIDQEDFYDENDSDIESEIGDENEFDERNKENLKQMVFQDKKQMALESQKEMLSTGSILLNEETKGVLVVLLDGIGLSIVNSSPKEIIYMSMTNLQLF